MLIMGSVALIVISILLFGLGLLRGGDGYLVGSIMLSLFAVIVLILAGRPLPRWLAGPAVDPVGPAAPAAAPPAAAPTRRSRLRWGGPLIGRPLPGRSLLVLVRRAGSAISGRRVSAGGTAEPPPVVASSAMSGASPPVPQEAVEPTATEQTPAVAGKAGPGAATEAELADGGELADEPPVESVPETLASRIARLTTEVHVVDGRPRYHLSGCLHLLGRNKEPIPVNEAVELGFTPCSLCEPGHSMLARVR